MFCAYFSENVAVILAVKASPSIAAQNVEIVYLGHFVNQLLETNRSLPLTSRPQKRPAFRTKCNVGRRSLGGHGC